MASPRQPIRLTVLVSVGGRLHASFCIEAIGVRPASSTWLRL